MSGLVYELKTHYLIHSSTYFLIHFFSTSPHTTHSLSPVLPAKIVR